MSGQTHADQIERIVRILSDAPAEGVSLDQIQDATEREGDRLTLREINMLICDLGNKVGHEKTRIKGIGKVTKFFLRLNRS